jgi:uncharacterized damage-inducible protein DinB
MKTRAWVGWLCFGTLVASGALLPQRAAGAGKSGFVSDFNFALTDVQKKVMSLEEAVPQDKFTWRPAPGVRSIAEVYLHIAFGNYFMTKMATGKEPPADVGFDKNRATWDTQTTDKAAIKKILERSFTHACDAAKGLSDADLEKNVSFFGHDTTRRGVLMLLLGHNNEHLGQSIAYARSNAVVPPWSKSDK